MLRKKSGSVKSKASSKLTATPSNDSSERSKSVANADDMEILKTLSLEYPGLEIIISGAGIGGLVLANALELVGVKYTIFEKQSYFRPLGSAILLNSQSYTFLDQLGLYDDLERISLPFKDLSMYTFNTSKHELKLRGSHSNGIDFERKFGYDSRVMPRPDLVEVLLKNLPKEKIIMGLSVVTVQQNEGGVSITTSDGLPHACDILVGADGCYSTVRKALFRDMEKTGILAVKDQQPLQHLMNCAIGVTEPLSLHEFPMLGKKASEFQVILDDTKPVSIWIMPMRDNRVGWMINSVMSASERAVAKEKVAERLKLKTPDWFSPRGPTNDEDEGAGGDGEGTEPTKSSDWSTEAGIDMSVKFGEYQTPFGCKFQRLLDMTKRNHVSKVALEEKFYETWHHGRIALIGDACHKTLPFGGVGAMNAIHDAIILANKIFDLQSYHYEDVNRTLTKYAAERKEHARSAVSGSSQLSSLIHSRGGLSNFRRAVFLNFVPKVVLRKHIERLVFYTPQASFLPQIQHQGKTSKTELSERYLKQKKAEAVKQALSLAAAKVAKQVEELKAAEEEEHEKIAAAAAVAALTREMTVERKRADSMASNSTDGAWAI